MKIGILGAGTWGIALAAALQNGSHDVTVWSALPEEIRALNATRLHPNLPGLTVPEGVAFTEDLEQACKGQGVVIFAVPSVFVRSTARKAAPFLQKGQIVADVAKGIEKDTLLTMTQILTRELPAGTPIAALSGPTHAEEVALGLPTTAVAASDDPEAAKAVQALFTDTCMRVYTGTDVIGVELCGAMKNIIALGTGIAAGLGYGDNTKAAIITRGLAEISRLGEKMGCRRETFAGLAGIGDLIVTATSSHSRNNRCGQLIGQGIAPADAIRQVGMVVEGIHALPAAMALQEKYAVEMPITCAVDRIVNQGADPADQVELLMRRSIGAEK